MKRIIAGILAVLVLVGCGGRAEETPNETINETAESTNIYAEDAQQLVYAVHAAHPVFVLDKVTPKYEAAEAEFLENAPNAEDKDEFALMVQKYLSSLDDEHTLPFVKENKEITSLTELRSDFLDALFEYNYEDEKLYLQNEDGTSSDEYIVKIGDTDINEIFAAVEEYFPMENTRSEEFYLTIYPFSKTILRLCGCDVSGDGLDVTLNDRTVTYRFADYSSDGTAPEKADVRVVNDILYIDINSFMEKDEKYAEALDEIRSYAQNGGKKVILDLRGNGGGYTWIVAETMRAFGTNLPYGGCIYRHTTDEWVTCVKDLKTAAQDMTYTTEAGSLNSARVNPDIDFVVLCDVYSMSASVITCAGVQDGKIGTVIGRSPHNSPSFYGGVLYYTLPMTGLETEISTAYNKRADENAPQDVFVPDIVTEPGENSLKYTIEQYYNETFNENDWE